MLDGDRLDVTDNLGVFVIVLLPILVIDGNGLFVLLILDLLVIDGPIGVILKLYVVCAASQFPFSGPTLSSILETSYTLK